MSCSEVQDRLVAWQDGELSPGETLQVGEHLEGCAACARLEARLDAATPRARLAPPAGVRAALADRVSAEVILALAERPPAPPPPPSPAARLGRWLRRDATVPRGAVAGYLVVLAVVVGWGLSSWWSLAALRAADADPHRAAQTSPATGAPEIPADQWRPAAYNPEEEAAPH